MAWRTAVARAVPAAWLRGGTSKGLYFQAKDLPPAGPERDALLSAAFGSPDASGMQLNGAGGGISSTSKVVIISPSERAGIDVDYLFGQVGIADRHIDWSGSCGNLAAGVGLFALVEGIIAPREPVGGTTRIRLWQVNQGYEIILHMAEGDDLLALAGVAGREPRVYVEICDPHAGKQLLPSGRVTDVLRMPDGSPVEATLVAAGNPTVFVRAEMAGINGSELPAQMDYSSVLPLVEHLRLQAAPLMGIEASDALRVAFVSGPKPYKTTSGEEVAEDGAHLLSRISTPGRIHHAHTGTGAIALACASHVQGSVPWSCIPDTVRPGRGEVLRIGHPGGVMEVRADVSLSSEKGWYARGAGFDRTARYLMRGEVFVPPPERAP